MIQYPLKFKVHSGLNSGIQKTWNTQASEQNPLTVAIPPEFEGPGGGFSPEDFYALALLNCFSATFSVIAEKSKLDYERLECSGTLTVDRNEKGAPWMKHFNLHVHLLHPSDSERAERLLQKTSESCMILNSVKTEIAFEFKMTKKEA